MTFRFTLQEPSSPSQIGHEDLSLPILPVNVEEVPLSADWPTFRLIELDLTKTSHHEVEGTVEAFDLEKGVEYEALSYCWGSLDHQAKITLNGHDFAVSQNLFAALRQLRNDQIAAGAPTKIWIDAICINQKDNAEKSHQVTLMKDIYERARRIVAWLGEPDAVLTPLAFDTLQQFAADDGTLDGKATCLRLIEGLDVGKRRKAVEWFMERPYFFRMWIVQEIVTAKQATLVSGAMSLDFETAVAGLRRMTGSGFIPFTGTTANITYISFWRDAFHAANRPEASEDLDLRLFLDTRDRSATDPRDKVYSLMGIVNRRITSRIRIDYDSANTVERVFTDFSKHVLQVRSDLQVLSAVYLKHRQSSKLKLPSYVPDWTQPKYGGGFLQRYYRFKPTHWFKSAGNTTPQVTVRPDTDDISIRGLYIDKITQVIDVKTLLTSLNTTETNAETGTGTTTTTPIFTLSEAALRTLSAQAFPSETYPFTGEAAWIVYLSTVSADRTALTTRIHDSYRAQFFASFPELGGVQPNEESLGGLPPHVWEEISKAVKVVLEDKVVFLTEKGYMGLGHEGLQMGDGVCVFAGGEVPFLVRPVPVEAQTHAEARAQEEGGEGGGEKFEFLCECYVHGIMDGEAVEGVRETDWREFVLQ